jgi:hypothetical protein
VKTGDLSARIVKIVLNAYAYRASRQAITLKVANVINEAYRSHTAEAARSFLAEPYPTDAYMRGVYDATRMHTQYGTSPVQPRTGKYERFTDPKLERNYGPDWTGPGYGGWHPQDDVAPKPKAVSNPAGFHDPMKSEEINRFTEALGWQRMMFVGGSYNGSFITLEPSRRSWLIAKPPARSWISDGNIPLSSTIEYEQYIKAQRVSTGEIAMILSTIPRDTRWAHWRTV